MNTVRIGALALTVALVGASLGCLIARMAQIDVIDPEMWAAAVLLFFNFIVPGLNKELHIAITITSLALLGRISHCGGDLEIAALVLYACACAVGHLMARKRGAGVRYTLLI